MKEESEKQRKKKGGDFGWLPLLIQGYKMTQKAKERRECSGSHRGRGYKIVIAYDKVTGSQIPPHGRILKSLRILR